MSNNGDMIIMICSFMELYYNSENLVFVSSYCTYIVNWVLIYRNTFQSHFCFGLSLNKLNDLQKKYYEGLAYNIFVFHGEDS